MVVVSPNEIPCYIVHHTTTLLHSAHGGTDVSPSNLLLCWLPQDSFARRLRREKCIWNLRQSQHKGAVSTKRGKLCAINIKMAQCANIWATAGH